MTRSPDRVESFERDKKSRKRTFGIGLFSVIEMLLGVASLVAGTGFLLLSLIARGDMFDFSSVFLALGVLVLITSLALLVGGVFTFSLKPSGRILNICLLIVMAFGSVEMLLSGAWMGGAVGLCLAVALLCYFCRPGVKRQFRAGNDEMPAPKIKSVAVLLAVLLGYWTWIYTVRRDETKFIIAFTAHLVCTSLLTYFVCGTFSKHFDFSDVATSALIVGIPLWLWAVIDRSIKPSDRYAAYML